MPNNRDRFESGLVDRLAVRYPERDADWIVEEILARLESPGIKNATALLIGAFKNAERDDTHRRGARPIERLPQYTPKKRSGGFNSVGRWDPEGSWESMPSKLLRTLAWHRKRSPSPPSRCAKHAINLGEIHQFDARQILPSIDLWLALEDNPDAKDSWYHPHAMGQNAAEVFVRFAGHEATRIATLSDLNFLHQASSSPPGTW